MCSSKRALAITLAKAQPFYADRLPFVRKGLSLLVGIRQYQLALRLLKDVYSKMLPKKSIVSLRAVMNVSISAGVL